MRFSRSSSATAATSCSEHGFGEKNFSELSPKPCYNIGMGTCRNGHSREHSKIITNSLGYSTWSCLECNRVRDERRRRAKGAPQSARRLPVRERFAMKTRPSENGCIEWTGHISSTGYGMFTIEPGRKVMAHRAAWELAYNEPPPPWPYSGLVLHHTCSNRRCVNIGHLELISHEENMSKPKPRNPSRKTRHCKCCPHYADTH